MPLSNFSFRLLKGRKCRRLPAIDTAYQPYIPSGGLDQLQKRITDYKAEQGKPFSREAELSEKIARMKTLDDQLNMDLNSASIPKREEGIGIHRSIDGLSLADRIQNAQTRSIVGKNQDTVRSIQHSQHH